MMQDLKFAQPYFFWLLLIIPIMILFYFLYLRRKSSQMRYSGISLFKNHDNFY